MSEDKRPCMECGYEHISNIKCSVGTLCLKCIAHLRARVEALEAEKELNIERMEERMNDFLDSLITGRNLPVLQCTFCGEPLEQLDDDGELVRRDCSCSDPFREEPPDDK